MSLKCFFFGHEWSRIHTARDSISFIEQCDRCKLGRYLKFLGHASFTGVLTEAEIIEWQRADLTPAPTQEPPAGGIIHVLKHTEPEGWPVREFMEQAWAEEDAEKAAGGVTISTEKKGGDEPCAPHTSNAPACSDSTKVPIQTALSTAPGASNSPADVPSEGRGESVVLPAFFLHTLVHMDCEFGAGRSCGESESCVTEYCLPCAAKVISRSGKYRLPTEGSGA